MSNIRRCIDCGSEYIFDRNNKQGATTSRCQSCTKARAKEETKRQMLEAAGGKCRCCGYSKCVAAMMFLDPVARIEEPPKPKNREEKIEWASHRIPLCVRCNIELDERYRKMKVINANSVPVDVIFWIDDAEVIEPSRWMQKTAIVESKPYADVEIIPPGQSGGEDARTFSASKDA